MRVKHLHETMAWYMMCAFWAFCSSWSPFLYTHTVLAVIVGHCPYCVMILQWTLFFSSQSYTYNYKASALQQAQVFKLCAIRPSPLVGGVWA